MQWVAYQMLPRTEKQQKIKYTDAIFFGNLDLNAPKVL